MEGLNRVELLGSLGADPELRFTQSGQAILNMRVATTERYQNKDKEWCERTEWHNVTLWGKRGEALAKILQKGAQVFVEGSLHTSSYEKEGEKRYKTEVNARNVILCGGKRAESSEKPAQKTGRGFGDKSAADEAQERKEYDGKDYNNDDLIPF